MGAPVHSDHVLPKRFSSKAMCLDRQLALRLMNHFGCSFAELPGGFLESLRRWQWDKLCGSLTLAVSNSPQYKKSLGREQTLAAIRNTAASYEISFPCPPNALQKEKPCPYSAQAAVMKSPHIPVLQNGVPRRSPHWQEFQRDSALLAAEGITCRFSAAVTSLLEQLPFTFSDDLSRSPDAFLAVSQGDVTGIISLPTSGTTGPGKRIYCTPDDLAETAAFFQYGMEYMVLPGQGEHVALLMSGDRPGSVGELLMRGMRALGVPCSVPGFVRPDPQGESDMLARLRELVPTCLVGVPGQVLGLARHARADELAKTVRCVLLSGDAVTPALRDGISAGLNCEVFVHYGLTETGLGGAVECGEHLGCHMREADMLFEILDESGRPLPDGVWGEIAVTTLTRRAMPLIRYRTGDEGLVEPGPCPCGSIFKRIRVRGRMSQRILLSDGSHLHITDIDRLLYELSFVQGYDAVLHLPPDSADSEAKKQAGSSCLALTVRYGPGTPSDARARVERSLAGLAGVSVVRTALDLERCVAALPLLIREQSECEDARRQEKATLVSGQAKQTIRHVREPVF